MSCSARSAWRNSAHGVAQHLPDPQGLRRLQGLADPILTRSCAKWWNPAAARFGSTASRSSGRDRDVFVVRFL